MALSRMHVALGRTPFAGLLTPGTMVVLAGMRSASLRTCSAKMGAQRAKVAGAPSRANAPKVALQILAQSRLIRARLRRATFPDIGGSALQACMQRSSQASIQVIKSSFSPTVAMLFPFILNDGRTGQDTASGGP
ncbi:hypothetical protein Q8A64_17905 [Oxalobacteraceae bacterium R-40]|uniref:Uncharacterized protein n=1 Tax=Keguizhuia sedimenti TaxID=3064264 RepID=A0ABU1BTE5_9BURK|nr:hypothetical protein [Oxalobacteraceae bacterium R-40]